MSLHCPDCLHPLARDPLTQKLPAICPVCGGALADDADAHDQAVGPADEHTTPSDIAALLHHAIAESSDDALQEASSLPTEATAPPGDHTAPTEAAADTPIDVSSDSDTARGSSIIAATASARTLPARAPARSSAWLWLLAMALLLTLILQALIADRTRLAGDPRWRPVVSKLCAVLQCTLPAWREPGAFSMLERDVTPLAEQPGILRVHATFRNDAQWPQPWPALQLSLADGDGRTVASRTLLPQEYLGSQPDQELAVGQSAQVSFLVREPKEGVVSFSFSFH